ncbi:hypothetical protein [Phyllobacterium sp. SB3]|uniref:hypothetical protein n=1 Tax=Phyllobacterium sp. SB3 TaxID=3156073 RepID=UPI0032AF04D7
MFTSTKGPMALLFGVREMMMSKTHAPAVTVLSTFMDWFRGSKNQQLKNETANHVHTEEFSDHMLRDIGVLDGRNSKGYTRKRSVDSLLNDNFNGTR